MFSTVFIKKYSSWGLDPILLILNLCFSLQNKSGICVITTEWDILKKKHDGVLFNKENILSTSLTLSENSSLITTPI
jgi:hypothetical protein